MKNTILSIAMFLLASVSIAQSKTIAEFEKDKGFTKKLFIYESYIRMLNMNDNPDYFKLVEDIEYIKVIRTGSESDKAQYRTLQSSIQKENFEEVFAVEDKDKGFASIYLLEEEGEKSQWIAFLFSKGSTYALEMNGNLNLEYMKGLSSLNYEMLDKYIEDNSFGGDWD